MAKFNEWVKQKWTFFTWTGPKKAPYGELLRPSRLPSVDYSSTTEKPITTTITVYVSGTYLTQKGKMFNIRERYEISITYSNSTIIEAMRRVRELAMKKFQEENPSFDVTNVFVPELIPDHRRISEPTYYYRGGKVWKYMTRISEGKLMLGAAKDIYKSNAERIIKKYGLKRREGQIRRL